MAIYREIIWTCISLEERWYSLARVWAVRLERWCGGAVTGALVTGNAFSEHLIASLQCRQKEDS